MEVTVSRPLRFVAGLLACASLLPACTAATPGASLGTPAGQPTPDAAPTASLSGTWAGSRPGDGMVMSFSGCGACADTPTFTASDVVMNVSDSSHALSGGATLTVKEAPPAGCPADPSCNQGPVGAVIAASVTGAVSGSGRVTMQWDATIEERPMVFILEGTVFANRMSGTVILIGGDIPGGSATGTWSVTFRSQ